MISNATADRYSDWINPMVMKELRQGLAGRTFHLAFLLIHVAMAIFLWFGLLQPDMLGGMVGILGFFLLLIQPAGALNAVMTERRAGSLDLVGLTNLSPWQIVWGKFCARASITLLFFVSILPYVVLRYFAGGLDLVGDAVILAHMLFWSLVLIAVMTGFSAFESKFLRGLIILGMILGTFGGGQFVSSVTPPGGMGGGAVSPVVEWVNLILSYLVAGVVGLLMLLVGAVHLSALSGQLETRTRLICLALLAAGLLQLAYTEGPSDMPPLVIWAAVAHLVVSFQGLTRPPSPDAVRLSPLAGTGGLGRMTGRLLHPGWPFAFLCLAVFSAVAFGGLCALADAASLPGLLWVVELPAMLFLPPLALSLLARRGSFPGWLLGWAILGVLLLGSGKLWENLGRENAGNDLLCGLSWCGLPGVSNGNQAYFWGAQGLIFFLSFVLIAFHLKQEEFFQSVRRMEILAGRKRAQPGKTT